MCKRVYSALLAVFVWLSVLGATPGEALEKLMASTSIVPEKTGVLIYELSTGRTVAAWNDGLSLVPASVMKVVTAASFTDKFGYADRLQTKVYYTGRIRDRVVEGDLIIEGCGDPSLGKEKAEGERDLAEEIAEALIARGITGIKGSVVIDDSYIAGAPVPPSWEKEDLNQSYGTGYHAFNYNGNASGKGAVERPDLVFASRLKTVLSGKGISVDGAKMENMPRTMLTAHDSQMLSHILRSCLFRSDNLYAEALLRLLGRRLGTDGSTEESARAHMDYLERAGYPMMYINVVDGSGLSRSNRLTVDFLGEVLGEKSEDAMFASLLPLVGEEGTVRNFMKETPLQGRMALKTGSMKGIQAYAGYKLNAELEPTHVVVVIANDLKNREKFRKDLSDFFLEIFAQ